MKIRLPKRQSTKETGKADPQKFYYIPIARSFYVARFSDAVRLLGGHFSQLLEVGCGSGIFLPELAKHCDSLFARDIHNKLSLTKDMLAAESVDVTLSRADARFLPYAPESMDGIVCMSFLEHLCDSKSPADEFYRVLRPGGVAIIGLPVSSILTQMILHVSCLTFDARLEDEHVSTHKEVLRAFNEKFVHEGGLNIPRLLPEQIRLYTTIRFRKPNHSLSG